MTPTIRYYTYNGSGDLEQWLLRINDWEDPVIIPYSSRDGRLTVCLELDEEEQVRAFITSAPMHSVAAGRLWFCNVDESTFGVQMSAD